MTTPANAVRITAMLLDAGAEIDAVADLYGGTTTLGLAATSVHPELAGVQEDLLTFLLDRGARLDEPWLADPSRGTPILARIHADPRMRDALGPQAPPQIAS